MLMRSSRRAVKKTTISKSVEFRAREGRITNKTKVDSPREGFRASGMLAVERSALLALVLVNKFCVDARAARRKEFVSIEMLGSEEEEADVTYLGCPS